MHTPRSLGLLSALVVLAALVAEGAAMSPAAAAASAKTTITIQRQFLTGVFTDHVGPRIPKDRAGFAGRLKDASTGKAVRGAPLTLQRKRRGADRWLSLATRKTATGGKHPGWAIFHTDVVGNARYRIWFPGDANHASSVSAPRRLRAMRDFNARLVQKGSGAHKRAVLKGDINPGWGHHWVIWQKKTCRSCRWHKVSHHRASRTGKWRFRAHYPPLHHAWFFRAKVRRTHRFVTSFSRVLRMRTVAG